MLTTLSWDAHFVIAFARTNRNTVVVTIGHSDIPIWASSDTSRPLKFTLHGSFFSERCHHVPLSSLDDLAKSYVVGGFLCQTGKLQERELLMHLLLGN